MNLDTNTTEVESNTLQQVKHLFYLLDYYFIEYSSYIFNIDLFRMEKSKYRYNHIMWMVGIKLNTSQNCIIIR